ncbi:MAG: CsgG/HfaB family protein, partial [Candidatus Neomarinimicrobiota bacterium]|nr:CsgG/HfaB family protein [Candidatus Neomarinimicrobiota bacterium]
MILSRVLTQELDDDLTLNKKPIIILPAKDADSPGSISNKITAILSQKTTEIGRFEVIDRRLVNAILEEQKLQLSGMIGEDQIVKIGELASAEEAFMVNVIEFGQKGVPKIIKPQQREKDEKVQNQDETLSTWVVKTMVGATAKAIVESAKSDA